MTLGCKCWTDWSCMEYVKTSSIIISIYQSAYDQYVTLKRLTEVTDDETKEKFWFYKKDTKLSNR